MEKDIITQKPTMQKQKDSLDFPKTKKSKIDEIFKDFNTKIEHNGKTSMAMRIEKGITDVYNRTKEYLNSLFKTAAIDSFKKIKQGIAIGTVLIGNLFNTAAVPNTFADANTYLKPQTYQVGVNGIKRINEYGQFGLIYTENTRSLHYQVIAKPIKNGTTGNNNDYIAYELNGLTNNGRWYQCALQYTNNRYYMIYMIWGGQNEGPGKRVPFNGNVDTGDKIDIKMNVKDHKIYMELHDLNTGAIVKKSFNEDADFFVGKKFSHGFYTGLMTEFDTHVKKMSMDIIPSDSYRYLSGELVSFYKVFAYLSISVDKHMHDIQVKNGKPIEYYAKDLTFINLFENIPKIEGKKMGENSSFKLDLKHFEIKSNGKTIYIIQKNN